MCKPSLSHRFPSLRIREHLSSDLDRSPASLSWHDESNPGIGLIPFSSPPLSSSVLAQVLSGMVSLTMTRSHATLHRISSAVGTSHIFYPFSYSE